MTSLDFNNKNIDDDDASFCSEDSFFADGLGYNKIGPATNLDRELLKAARDGELARAQELVKHGADVNYNTYEVWNHFTPLCLAIESGHVELLQWLLEQPNIDLNKPCCVGAPLKLAAGKNPRTKSTNTILDLLLAHGARDDEAIVRATDLKTIERLLQNGADINKADDEKGNTLLHALCSSYVDDEQHVELIRKVLELGANANAKNEEGDTPLHNSYMSVNVCRVLLEQGGADLEATNKRGQTVFLKSFRPSVHEFLITKGANVNAADKEGTTSLHDVCYGSESRPGADMANLNILLPAGANVNARGRRGQTVIGQGIEHRKTEVVQRLLQEGAEPNLADNKGWNALHTACYRGRSEFLDMLFEAGVNVDAPTNKGWSPLNLAVASIWNSDNDEIVRKLLQHGADANFKNPSTGSTPLGGAMSQYGSNLKQVTALVELGADVNAVTTNKRVRDLEYDDSHDEASDDEKTKPKKVKEAALVEETPLHWAIAKKHQDSAVFLLNHGAETEVLNGRGETPLLHASKLGLEDVVARLLELGVTVDRDVGGGKPTPLSEASKAGHLGVIRLLTPHQLFT